MLFYRKCKKVTHKFEFISSQRDSSKIECALLIPRNLGGMVF